MVAIYEPTKKGLIFFYTKRQVRDDGIHRKPMNLKELIHHYKIRRNDAMY